MRVLMPIRNDAFIMRGGDIIQMEKTKYYLEQIGISCKIIAEDDFDGTNYDLVHLSNLIIAEDTFKKLINAKKFNKPIVFSSIYWNKDEYILNNPTKKASFVIKIGGKRFARWMMRGRRYYARAWHLQREILKSVDIILTTSLREKELLEEDYRIKIKNYRAIPIGVEPGLFNNLNTNFLKRKYNLEKYFLCVGRFENLKNQLWLIKIFGSRKEHLVLAGNKNPNQEEYYSQCLDEAKKYKNINIIEYLPQSEIFSLMAGAIAHIAPSWFETFGLVSLEAAAAGTNVITTHNSPIEEFFGDSVYYFKPEDKKSLSTAINKAINSNPDPNLSKVVLNNYTWGNVARKIVGVYKELLNI